MLFTKGKVTIVHNSFYSYSEHKNIGDTVMRVGSVNKTT